MVGQPNGGDPLHPEWVEVVVLAGSRFSFYPFLDMEGQNAATNNFAQIHFSLLRIISFPQGGHFCGSSHILLDCFLEDGYHFTIS